MTTGDDPNAPDDVATTSGLEPTTPNGPPAELIDGGPSTGAVEAVAPARPGLSTFTIEGRAAPGLFVVGWLATILGGGILVIGFQAPHSVIASVLILGGLSLLAIGLVSAAGSQAIERRTRGVTAYTGPSPYLLLAASVAVASILTAAVGLVVRVAGGEVGGPLTSVLVLAVIQVTYLGLIRLLVVGTGALSWADMGVRGGTRRIVSDLAWGASFAVPVIAMTLLVATVLASFVSATPDSPLPATGTTGGLLLNLLGGAILVPIGEEMLFRGVATTAWRRVFGLRRAIVQGGLFFAVVHVLQVGGSSPLEALSLALVAFVTRIPVALTLGWLFTARESIWASIGLHSAFNGILLVLAEIALRARPPGG